MFEGDMGSGFLSWGAATVALVGCGVTYSADLEPAMKVPPALWSWTGGYIGVHGGGGYGRTSFSDPYGPLIDGDIVKTPAFLAGGQIGYNWQANGWVFGAELDASRAVSDGTNSCLAFSGNVVIATCNAGPNVFVTGTARVGYAFGPQGQTLAYIKAGVAWQNNRGDIANKNEFQDGSFAGYPRRVTEFDYGRLARLPGDRGSHRARRARRRLLAAHYRCRHAARNHPPHRRHGCAVFDVETARLAADFEPNRFAAFLETAGTLKARAILIAGDDPDEARLTEWFAKFYRAAAPHGLTADLEFTPWTAVMNATAALRIVTSANEPNGRVLIDVLHAARSATSLDDIASLPRRLLS
ncbi:outer membrane beta-barrel protein [Bradyrhizobium sp. CCGUVB23]|uniref:outer membrane beta-barrel protein n=1 Tax=Bradyrhizobium sp. CCGUVB23 TaxID=2949630 RepID=UPI0020B3CBF2|nr:outer membrane beta-barrel protein [Bradyrhizobium sp. CCGUVB23]MCP3460287.1 outer membrane beta-barrel protein [Bradyrhizobium sp. CCGUVB23]